LFRPFDKLGAHSVPAFMALRRMCLERSKGAIERTREDFMPGLER
jgi:hypothetical protein